MLQIYYKYFFINIIYHFKAQMEQFKNEANTSRKLTPGSKGKMTEWI